MASGYKRRPTRRKSHHRDAKLIIIATEGIHTERIYFEDLTSPDWFRNPHLQVEVLSNLERDSAPERVLAELDIYQQRYRLEQTDELWMVIDVDRWGDRQLSAVARLCQQKGYLLAVSNPCFELWLLLHLKAMDAYTPQEQIALFENQKVTRNRTYLEQELVTILGSYNKSNPDTAAFLPFVEIAVERAELLDTQPDDRWPQTLGTRVYLLVKQLIANDEIH
ncbi:MAG: RloB family protein [Chloroflexota bacterium]